MAQHLCAAAERSGELSACDHAQAGAALDRGGRELPGGRSLKSQSAVVAPLRGALPAHSMARACPTVFTSIFDIPLSSFRAFAVQNPIGRLLRKRAAAQVCSSSIHRASNVPDRSEETGDESPARRGLQAEGRPYYQRRLKVTCPWPY